MNQIRIKEEFNNASCDLIKSLLYTWLVVRVAESRYNYYSYFCIKIEVVELRFLTHKMIDKDAWNRCIGKASYSTIFADYDFLTLASPKWCAVVKGDYEYVMPLPVRSRLSVRYIYTPFFISRLGIFSEKPVTKKIIEDFIGKVPVIYRQIDLFFHPDNPIEYTELSPVDMISYQLKLNRPYILTKQLFSENTKRNIRAASKYDLALTEDVALEDVVALFQNGRGKRKQVHYGKKDYQMLLCLATYAQQKGVLDVVGVNDEEGHLLAAAFFLKDQERTWFWFSGRDENYSEKKAMFFLVDEYLKLHEQENRMLDFNGSMNENVARFYKGFGAEPYHFSFLNLRRYSYLSPFIKIYKAIVK